MKLSKKQESIIRAMREGMRLYTVNGFNAKVGTSQNFIKVSFPTLWKLKELGIITVSKEDFRSTDYVLSELGKTIGFNHVHTS